MKKLSCTERHDDILKAAIQSFSKNGFRGTKTSELAKKAKVSEALLFRHFPNKKKLYEAILEKKMEEQVPSILDNLPKTTNLSDTLHEISRRVTKQHSQDTSFLRLLWFSALEGHELSDLFFQRRTLPLLDFLQNLFRKHKESLKAGDPEWMARCFLAMLFGFIESLTILKIPQVVGRKSEDTLKTYIHIFLKGIEVS